MVWKTRKDSEERTNFSSTNFKVDGAVTCFCPILWVKDQYLLAQHFKNKLQEHVHVYKKSLEGNNEGFAAPFHTDNGLLLMVTPFQVTFFFS